MRRKLLSSLLIMLLVLSLFIPSASFGATEKSSGLLHSKFQGTTFDFGSKVGKIDFESLKADKVERMKQERNIQSQFKVEKNDLSSMQLTQNRVVAPQNFVPASDSNEEITVIVELQAKPLKVFEAELKQSKMNINSTAISQQSNQLMKEHAAFQASLQKVLNLKTNREYSKVFNGFSIKLPANKVDTLLKMPGIKAIYPNKTYEAAPLDSAVSPMMDESAPHIGSGAFWDLGYTGQNIKVGVIDTGVDYNHPSLAGAYQGGYDFVDNDSDPMETLPDPSKPPKDGRTWQTDHGTHVSGTIVGRGDPNDPNSPTGWVRGVAPGAKLYVYRVLGPYGSGSEEDVIAGVEAAMDLGIDVINLSLGSSINDQHAADSIALNNAMITGVVAVTSNGNSGPGDFTNGSPAASEMAISVGATNPPMQEPALNVEGLDRIEANYASYSPELGTVAGNTYPIVYVGLGRPEDYANLDVTGKVVLISRGSISFGAKATNATNAGAVAAIIHNNVDGALSATLGAPGTYVPTMTISLAEGLAIQAKITAGSGSASITLSNLDVTDLVADFSSRGPALPGLDIKPDITAPGVAIRSSIPGFEVGGNYANAYADFNGTSMASPHVAGAAALILDKQANLNPFEIKSLLMNNAHKITDIDSNRYSHMAQGAGRVDLVNVLDAKSVAMVEESTDAHDLGSDQYQTGSISFGQLNTGATATKTITVKDIAGVESSYDISTIWYGSVAGNLTTSVSNLTVSAGGQAQFTVSLDVAADTTEGRYEGEVILTGSDSHTLQVPIAVYVGHVDIPDPISNLVYTPDIISPNGDTLVDDTDITFDINRAIPYFSIDIYRLAGNELVWAGNLIELEDGIDSGSYIINNWNGIVNDYEQDYMLEDDLYVAVPWYGDGENYYRVDNAKAPFVIDTAGPTSTLADPAYVINEDGTATISGQVVGDLFVDIFGDYRAIGVAAVYEENGDWEQADGDIDATGHFTVDVPLQSGNNAIEVYVYDAAYNGVMVPSHVLEIYLTPPPPSVSVHTSADHVDVDESFDISLDFARMSDLYSAQFSLTYDESLTAGAPVISEELSAYQEAQNPGTGLIWDVDASPPDAGKITNNYIISLAGDFSGYTGNGAFITIPFSSSAEGSFNFSSSNVRLLDSQGNDIAFDSFTPVTVVVEEEITPPTGFVISGQITAEGFGADFNHYDEVWYNDGTTVHKVVVKAVGEAGTVYGTVNANGTYSISVPAGTYNVEVSVPGHLSASQQIVVDSNKTANFNLIAGDIDGDGVVDLRDITLAAKAFGKTAPWTEARFSAADINRDGEIDLTDISFILTNFGATR